MNSNYRNLVITASQLERLQALLPLHRPTGLRHRSSVHQLGRELLDYALETLEAKINENAKEPTENEPQRPDSI